MSDNEAKQKRDAQDRYELGPVEHVNDLAPETGIGPTRKAKASERIIQPQASGYFENEGGAHDGMGAPLHLGDELRRHGSPFVGQYEGAYNAYAIPLRSTLRAMGRLKDVSLTGAPMTPEELKQRPDLLARFRKLNAYQGDVPQEKAYHDWSAAQTKLDHSIEWFRIGQNEFPEAIANYRRAQQLLRQRQLEHTKASKMTQAHAIEEVAETIGRIIDTVSLAWSAASATESLLGTRALAAEAEGIGTLDNSLGAGGSLRTKAQRFVDGASHVAADGRAIAAHAKQQLGKAGNVELSLDSILIQFVDRQKYTALKRDMAKLDAEIALLGLSQEQEIVHSATAQLKRVKLEFKARVADVQADRVAARSGAKMYAKTMGADMNGISAMYAAEAYQELAAFGRVAALQRKQLVDPLWGKVVQYLGGVDKSSFEMLHAVDDAAALTRNVQAVEQQRTYFNKHLPQWEISAKQWSGFLATQAGSPLVAELNDADRMSEAP